MSENQQDSNVALVTGGTRGIGAGIAQALKADGWQVVATYQGNDDAAKQFSDSTEIPVIKFNVSDSSACEEAIANVTAQYGVVSVLVNNAGIARDGTLIKMSDEKWHDVMKTNLDSVFYLSRSVLGGMVAQKFGRIVNISSINGLKGQLGQTNYAASKAGMVGLSKSLALETARKGVCVNVVAPGYIDTEMMQAIDKSVLEHIIASIPVQRLGRVEEIARLVAFLAHRDSGFITGATFSINGGQYMQ